MYVLIIESSPRLASAQCSWCQTFRCMSLPQLGRPVAVQNRRSLIKRAQTWMYLCNQEWWNSNVGIRRFRLNFQNGHLTRRAKQSSALHKSAAYQERNLARAHENVDFVNSATPLEADELFLNWLISQSSGGLEPLDVVMTVDPLFTHSAETTSSLAESLE